MPAAVRRTVVPALPALILALVAPRAAHAQRVVGDASASRVAAGASRTVLVLDSIDLAGIGTLSELLQARVPGLLVSARSGSAGAGATIVARGRRSVMADGEPLLVIDGLRAVGAQRSMELDTASSVSRLDDVVLEHVERVEVLRGPAASARYGVGAAHGAIVVTTRAGRAGDARRTAYARTAVARDVATYPTLYAGRGRSVSGAPVWCPVAEQQRGGCTLERIDAQPYDVPVRTGLAAAVGATVGGGGRSAQYWLGADARRAQGVLPGNEETRAVLRANLDWQPRADLRLALRTAGTRRDVELPRGDQRGLLSVDAWFGRFWPERWAGTAPQEAWRGDASVQGEWAPRGWLRLRADGGISDLARTEYAAVAARDTVIGFPPRSWVITRDGLGHEWIASGGLAADLAYGAGAVRATTTVGMERLGSRVTRASGFAIGSVVGGPSSRASRFMAIGTDLWSPYVAQHVALGDRLAVDASLRSDRGAGLTIGGRSTRELSASASAAWTAWRDGAGSRLQLRAAHGTSVAPLGPEAVELWFLPCIGECSASRLARSGAERTREWEAGLDASLAGRHALRLTAFDQRSTDVVMPNATVVSTGFGLVAMPGLVAVGNRGLEAEASASLLDRPAAGLTIAGRMTLARNRVESMPGQLVGNPTATIGGQPLEGFYDAPVTIVDADGDGSIDIGEATWTPWPAQGVPSLIPSSPTRLAALDVRLRLGRSVRVGIVADHRGGHAAYGARPDLALGADRARFDDSMPLREQAFALDGELRQAGLMDRADVTRLREVVVSYALGRPARATRISVAGRNLATWSGFRGPDAEVVALPPSSMTSAYYRQPLPATVALRLDTSF